MNLLFGGFMFAFAVKAPLWPFHRWLPDAAVEATPASAVLMMAVMDKVGIQCPPRVKRRPSGAADLGLFNFQQRTSEDAATRPKSARSRHCAAGQPQSAATFIGSEMLG